MTRKDYLPILKNSEIYKLLDEKTQRIIAQATNEMMDTYSKIFITAAEMERQYKTKFIQETQEIYDNFYHNFQQKNKKIRIILEQANQIEDDMESQLLLNKVEKVEENTSL